MNAERKPRKKRPTRRQLADEALDRLLGGIIPEKDTGPDPTDIRPAEIDALSRHQVTLDEDERARANEILNILFELTGRQMDVAEALRVALNACPLEQDGIARAFAALRAGRQL